MSSIEANTTRTIDYELWRRGQARRERELLPELTPEQRLLAPLALALARLAAQRDAKGGGRRT